MLVVTVLTMVMMTVTDLVLNCYAGLGPGEKCLYQLASAFRRPRNGGRALFMESAYQPRRARLAKEQPEATALPVHRQNRCDVEREA